MHNFISSGETSAFAHLPLTASKLVNSDVCNCQCLYKTDLYFKVEIIIVKLETLPERRPPWPRQIIIPILSTVKMLSLASERLTPKVWMIAYTTNWLCYRDYGVFCSFIPLRILRSPPKFNQFFIVLVPMQDPSIKFHPNPLITF